MKKTDKKTDKMREWNEIRAAVTPEIKAVLDGLVCPYCKQPSVWMDSAPFYNGRSFGMVYACVPCRAWVGVHKNIQNTDLNQRRALGRLANSELREAKKAAHASFDRLWQSGLMKRMSAYEWLSYALPMPPELSHIGMFGKDTCRRVVELSTSKYDELTRTGSPST